MTGQNNMKDEKLFDLTRCYEIEQQRANKMKPEERYRNKVNDKMIILKTEIKKLNKGKY